MSPENMRERELGEQTPESLVGDAITPLETENAAGVTTWRESGKRYFKTGGKFLTTPLKVGAFFLPRMVWGLLRFAKELAEKKGNVSFSRAREIGESMLNPEVKKGDKK